MADQNDGHDSPAGCRGFYLRDARWPSATGGDQRCIDALRWLESASEDISESEPKGRLKNNILISVSDFERRNTTKKTRIKMREQAMRGYLNGGRVPYGYTYDRNTQSLQKHPTDSLVIRRIFEQAAQLVSIDRHRKRPECQWVSHTGMGHAAT